MGHSIPILTYHSIDDSGSVVSTSISKFQEQIRYLHDNRFDTISFHEVIATIRKKAPFPPKCVCITFDDGFKSVFHVAYPVLRKYDYSATVFLVPGYCGKNNNWEGQPDGIPILDLLSWEEIAEMADNRFEFGAHTMNHANLVDVSSTLAKQEIINSKNEIQNHLNKEIQSFAYPYGKVTERIRKVTSDNFCGSCSTELGFASLKSDLYMLPRIDMYYFSKNNFFSWIGTARFSQYIFIRRILRSIGGKFHFRFAQNYMLRLKNVL